MTTEHTAMQPTIALEAHAVSRQTNAGLTMLFDRAKGVMYELNESASAIVTVLTVEPQSYDEVVDKLLEEFDADRKVIEEDVRAFVREFSEAGLVKTAD